jgi:hypothetical protein
MMDNQSPTVLPAEGTLAASRTASAELWPDVLRTNAKILFAAGVVYWGIAISYYFTGNANIWQLNRVAAKPLLVRVGPIYACHPWDYPFSWRKVPRRVALKLAAAIAAPRRRAGSFYQPSPSMFLKFCVADGSVRYAAVWPRQNRLLIIYYPDDSTSWEISRGAFSSPLAPMTKMQRDWLSLYTPTWRSERWRRRQERRLGIESYRNGK